MVSGWPRSPAARLSHVKVLKCERICTFFSAPGKKMRGVFLPLSLAPSFQPSASRACAYVACTFVYRKGGLRLAVVRDALLIESYMVNYATFPHRVLLSSPCKLIIAQVFQFVKGFLKKIPRKFFSSSCIRRVLAPSRALRSSRLLRLPTVAPLVSWLRGISP